MAPSLFPILLEVEESAVGPVLKLLKNYPGIAKLHLDLDNVGKKPGKSLIGSHGGSRQKKSPEAPRGKDILIGELMSGPKNLQHLRDKYSSFGMSPGNVSSAINELQQKNITESAGKGVHRLTPRAMEELKKERSTASADKVPKLPKPRAEASKTDQPISPRGASRMFVLEGIRDGKTRAELNTSGAALGIGERMIDGAMSRLRAEKLIIREPNNPGHYKLTEKGKKATGETASP